MNKKTMILNKFLPVLLVAVALLIAVGTFFAVSTDISAADGDDYFWAPVGGSGTGNWSDVSHWSSTDDGTGGDFATLPNATNNVYFTANSFTGAGQVVTVDATAYCKDMDWTGATNNPTLAGSEGLRIYGSTTFIEGMNVTQSLTYFYGTGSNTLTSAGKSLGSCYKVSTGTLTFADTVSMTALYLNGGEINTNNQIVNLTGAPGFASSTADGKTLTLGSSTITTKKWNYTGTNLIVTANTATINITTTGELVGGSADWNGADFNLNGTSHTVSGSFTCANLTRTGTATKTDSVTFESGKTVTVTGTLTLAGNSATNRLLVQSSTLGSAAILNAATVAVSNADFMDITGAGAGDWDISACTGGSGDCGGNTDITFTTSATQTSTKASDWSDATMWTSRVPLPQDDVSCSHNVTVDMPRIGKSITFTGTPTVGLSNHITNYGSLTLATGMTYTPSFNINYIRGRGVFNVTTNGNTLFNLIMLAPNGTYTLQDNFTSIDGLRLDIGTFDFNDKDVIGNRIDNSTSSSLPKTVYLGNGTITLTQDTEAAKFALGSNCTLYCEDSTIVLTNPSANAQTFEGGGLTYNNVIVQGAGNYNLTITGNNTFNTFKVDASQAAKTITQGAAVNQTVNDFTRDAGGTNVITLTGGTWTKSDATPIALDYITTDSTASPAATWYAGSNGTDAGATDWVFDDPTLTVTTDAATGVTMDKDGVTGGTFNGTVTTDLDGTPTIVTYFEYGLTAAYGSQTANVTVYDNGAVTGIIPPDLTPGETYHFRIVVENGNAGSPFVGDDGTFTLTMPTVTTGTETNIENHEVTLNGNITNMGVASDTYAWFEWGLTNAYGNATSTQTINAIGPVSANIDGLLQNVTYHYRLRVMNGATIVSGTDQTLITAAYTGGNNVATVILPIMFLMALLFGMLRFIARSNEASNSGMVVLIFIVVIILVGLTLLASAQGILNTL